MVVVTREGTVEPFCCWLRLSPPDLDINLHCTYSRILEAVRTQQWFPPNCHYCAYRPKQVDDYERHVVKRHPGKMAYPNPTPENVARILYIVESIGDEFKHSKAATNEARKSTGYRNLTN
jgi:hypothetical protein